MPVYRWSQTSSSNGSADPFFTWAEGQAPSSINDSARAQTAELKKYFDDIAGAIVTTGTATAYAVTSYSNFTTLVFLDKQPIAFTPHATNGAGPVTLSVDSLGAKPLRTSPGVELLAGTLIQGTPYVALYSNADAAFYLAGFYGNAYNVPLGGMLPFIGSTAPNSSFVFPFGQAISRTTYATLFSLVSTTYGTGDGSTTFNVPDLRGRVFAGKDDMGGSAASRLTTATMSGTGLGATSSATETKTLATANLPAYTPSGSVTSNINSSGGSAGGSNVLKTSGIIDHAENVDTGVSIYRATDNVSLSVSSSFSGNAQGGTSTPFAIVQPTIIGNFILRVI